MTHWFPGAWAPQPKLEALNSAWTDGTDGRAPQPALEGSGRVHLTSVAAAWAPQPKLERSEERLDQSH